MKLVMDLVVNHTSDEHPWFVSRARRRDSPKRDWYWWRPPRPDARRPGASRRTGVVLLRPGLGARRATRRVLPAPVLAQAARPQLGEPRGPRGGLRDDALVARPRGRRLPHGRHQHDLQGPGLPDGRCRRRTATARRILCGPRIHEFLQEMHREVFAGRDALLDRRRDARRDASRRRALFTDPARARGRHGLPVRARRSSTRARRKWDVHPLRLRDLKALVRALAGRPGRRRLEQPLLEQPRPAAGRVALRRRRRAPRALGQAARHRAAPAPRHAVRLPGRGARHDERAVRAHRRLPRHRVAQPLRRGASPPARPGRRARRPARDEPRQRAHADAVGRLAARRLHAPARRGSPSTRTTPRSTPRRRWPTPTRCSTTTGG